MKTIVWDVDDVLNSLMYEWFRTIWMPTHPNCALSYQQLSENPPHRILGISLVEYQTSLDAFRISSFATLEPIPEIFQWFKVYGSRFRNIALTATPLRLADLSAAWVLKYYGLWIRSFNVIPSRRAEEDIPVYDQSKEDYLKWMDKADVLVDDSKMNINAAHKLGIKAVLMPQPWNGCNFTTTDTLNQLTDLIK